MRAKTDPSEYKTETGKLQRRTLLKALPATSLGLGPMFACRSNEQPPSPAGAKATARDSNSATGPVAAADAVLEVFPLSASPWQTFDPFLFCVHHDDAYPTGNAQLGPEASLEGRNIGSDFAGKDGWSMYHGDVVPGFPRHPHRGFETVTVTRRGFVDHSDSLGATARYGQGDVQWMTAGSGIVHAEMFPLLESQRANPAELLQIWINLPQASKFASPHFSMFWHQHISQKLVKDARGRQSRLRIVAGRFDDKVAPAPPPDSWAARTNAEVAIWTLEMAPGASLTLPSGSPGANRTLYFYRGSSLHVETKQLTVGVGVRLKSERPATLVNGNHNSELLLLAGQPIAEPVVKRGPFVMNSTEEIRQAYADYRATQFGGWPWPGNGPVHARQKGRFAVHADGRVDKAPV